MEDITERKWFEQKMQTALITDELTGLYNKRGFLEHGIEQLKLAFGRAKVSTLFRVTLDGMKEVNEAIGQKQGDAIIKETGQMLREALTGKGMVGRTGGVEFSVLIEDATEVEAAQIDDCIARFELAHRENPLIRLKVRAVRCLRSEDLLPELQYS
jgi:diguanylate cyclase (GGDEF)-like protein